MAKTVLLKSGFTSHLKDNSINVKCLAQVSRPGLEPTLFYGDLAPELEFDALNRNISWDVFYIIIIRPCKFYVNL